MITKIDPIRTPPTPAETPAAFEEMAAQVWADLYKAVPQMNQQALDIEAVGEAADAAMRSAQSDSDAALGYRNEANAAKNAAQNYAGSAAQSSVDSDVARGAAIEASGDAESAAARAEEAAVAAESVAVNAVQQTSATGAALLPEGSDAERPAVGSIPAGKLVIRGNTQDEVDYKPEFWDRGAGVWKVVADRTWVEQQIGFTMLYPNGGSAAAPANVAVNSRYVMPNPFPGHHVFCIAEVQVGGVWGESGWVYSSSSSGGYGVKASQSSTEGIVVRTGSIAVASTGADSGGSFTTVAIQTPVPCRVKVWKLKGAM